MAMALLVGAFAAASVHVASGQFPCPSGWTDKSGTPKCNGAVSSTCTATACCQEVPTCSDFAAAWLVSQVLGQGCAAETKFFDTKKYDAVVASPQGSDEVEASCCTPVADALCSDWGMSCAAGTELVGTNGAAADGGNGMTLSQTGFQDTCCVETSQTCSNFAAVWLVSQVLGAGCAAETKFFDTKRYDAVVASPHGTEEVSASCCTPFAEALCSDWGMSCAAGTELVGTNGAAADGGNGMTLSQTSFQDTCCVETSQTCSNFAAAWLVSQVLGAGCATETKFFDTKRYDAVVVSPHGNDEVTSSCCTPFAEALCSDWGNTMSCAAGTSLVGTNAAAPDGENGMTLTQTGFRSACCEEPMACASYTAANDVSGAVLQSTASMLMVAGVVGTLAL